MRVKIWNSFSSNNSGSYTLVGSFRDVEVARETAAALQAVVDQQSAWFDADEAPPSPLQLWVRKEGLTAPETVGLEQDWPEYDDQPPAVVCVGQQVLLHVGYTVTMPAALGEFIYRRGGRVQTEVEHAHHPLVLQLIYWMHWREKRAAPESWERAKQSIVDAVENGGLDAIAVEGDGYGVTYAGPAVVDYEHGSLLVGVVSNRVALAARTALELADSAGLQLRLEVREPLEGESDPFGALRVGGGSVDD